MKKIYFAIAILATTGSCLKEKSVSPAVASTFVRYYNGGNNDKAIALSETTDNGFIILATTEFKPADVTLAASYKIKLIKTDAQGAIIWQQFFPDFNQPGSYKAHSIQVLPDGNYVIAGEDIKSQTVTNALLLMVDATGAGKTYSIPAPVPPSPYAGFNFSGRATAANSSGDFLVLSTSDQATSAMLLSSIKKDLSGAIMWTKDYSAGRTSLANHLYLDANDKVFWAGTVIKNNGTSTGIRVVKTSQNSKNVDFDLFLLNPNYEEEATDFCRFGLGYAIIGSTNEKQGTAGNKDILFKRLSQDGMVLKSQSFPLGYIDDGGNQIPDSQDDSGASISSTQDGGLILLSSVGSAAIKGGRGDSDYLLIKINAFGEEDWRSNFGSRFKDTGVSVRQASDGGYMVLGTSTQGGLDIIMLAKTSGTGKIE